MTIFSVGNHIWGKTKRWWVEGDRKFRYKKISHGDFRMRRYCLFEFTEDKHYDIQVAQTLLPYKAVVHSIFYTTDTVKIGYYEEEPERNTTVNTQGVVQ